MNKVLFGNLFLVGAVCAFVSCDIRKQPGMNDYIQTAQSGLQTLTWPKEMESLFGDSDHFITHYGFSPGPKEWHSKVYIYGRYELTLVVDVTIDYNRNKITGATNLPKFYLVRVASLLDNGQNAKGARYDGQWEFGQEQWAQLVKSQGDFASIGIPVETNNPVVGFPEYVKGNRALLVRIPH